MVLSTSKGGSDLVELGNGDYEVDTSSYESTDYVSINFDNISPGSILTLAFTSIQGTSVGFVAQSNHSISAGDSTLFYKSGRQYNVNTTFEGCCVVVVDNKFVARIAIHKTSSVQDIMYLPVPLYARGSGDTNLPMTLQGSPTWAGWRSALPAGDVVRMTGFNLPRQLTSYSGETPHTINAERGNYGIEFTIPQDSDSVAIFDETFWLYIR